jgi:uracil-DNA glycosylase
MNIPIIGNDWDEILYSQWENPLILSTLAKVEKAYQTEIVYPPKEDIFYALQCTPFHEVKVVILGQDPYIKENQAHGLAFSVLPNNPIPPSLKNVFIELQDELGCYIPNNGYLEYWAKQGVLLLNSVLTVTAGKSHSHSKFGWQYLTDYIIKSLSDYSDHSIIFMLWGDDAKSKTPLIDEASHLILQAAHPSPLARGKFFGCDHFIQCNNYLDDIGSIPIDWQIPNIEITEIKSGK